MSSGHYQIRLSRTGPWHRRQHDTDHTACGLPIVGAYLSRDWQIDTDLCPECFTKRERDTGEMMRLERAAIEEAKAHDLVEAWGYDNEITDEHEPELPGPVRSDDAGVLPVGDDSDEKDSG